MLKAYNFLYSTHPNKNSKKINKYFKNDISLKCFYNIYLAGSNLGCGFFTRIFTGTTFSSVFSPCSLISCCGKSSLSSSWMRCSNKSSKSLTSMSIINRKTLLMNHSDRLLLLDGSTRWRLQHDSLLRSIVSNRRTTSIYLSGQSTSADRNSDQFHTVYSCPEAFRAWPNPAKNRAKNAQPL